jgi:hypothetical protein
VAALKTKIDAAEPLLDNYIEHIAKEVKTRAKDDLKTRPAELHDKKSFATS